jgi:hypothetical protein
VLFPAFVFGAMTLVPWLDRTNRRVVGRFEYLQPPTQAPVRLSLGVGALSLIGMLWFASYYDQVGLTLGQIWLLTLAVPVVVGLGIFGAIWTWRRGRPTVVRFDPTSEP